MYPETDVPPLVLKAEEWANVMETLPMSDEDRASRLAAYEMSTDQAEQLLARELDDVFCKHVASLPAKAWAALLLNHDSEHPQTLANILCLREEGRWLAITLTTWLRPTPNDSSRWMNFARTVPSTIWHPQIWAAWRT